MLLTIHIVTVNVRYFAVPTQSRTLTVTIGTDVVD